MDAEFSSVTPEIISPRRDVKFFSVAEADRALALVRRIVSDIRTQYAKAQDLERQYQTAVYGSHQKSEVPSLQMRREEALTRLEELVGELTDLGVELKDWETGLVDFPSIYQNREVCLCWRFGEETVTHWHEVHAGFAGRQPITELF
jgi:hypothetical protein